jgi:hypothetical protein
LISVAAASPTKKRETEPPASKASEAAVNFKKCRRDELFNWLLRKRLF